MTWSAPAGHRMVRRVIVRRQKVRRSTGHRMVGVRRAVSSDRHLHHRGTVRQVPVGMVEIPSSLPRGIARLSAS